MTPRNRERDEHDRFRVLAAAAVDGRLDPDSAAILEEHLSVCPTCRADQQAMLADHAWLAEPGPASEPDARVRAAILEAARSPRIPRTSDAPRRPWVALVAASMVVAIALTGIAISGRRTPAVGGPPTGTPSVTGLIIPTNAPSAANTPIPLPAGVPIGSCAPRESALAAWWPAEDPRDVVGAREAVLHGRASFTPGLVGDALTLDGATAYGELPYDPTLLLRTQDFTILLWVRFASVAGEQVLIEQWQDTGGGAPANAGWTLTKLEDQVILFTSEADGAGQGGSTPSLDLRADTWYHVAVRRSGGEVTVFVDGIPIGAGSAERAVDVTFESPLLFGRRGDDRGLLLNGQLDEIQIVLGEAMFETDIRTVYQSGRAGTCRP